MKPLSILTLLLVAIHARFAVAQTAELKLAIAEIGAPRRWVIGDERSQIMVLIVNASGQPQRVWQTWNSWGARTITIEVLDQHGAKLGRIVNSQRVWAMNGPSFDTIAPGDYHLMPITVHGQSPWQLEGEALQNLEPNVWHHAQIRALFTSKDAEGKGVWTGHLETPFYDFELRVRGDAAGAQAGARALRLPAPEQNLNVPDLKTIPDGEYAVNLEWWGRKQSLTVAIHNNEARVIQSSDPLLQGIRAPFRRGDEGNFKITFQTLDGQIASEYWIPQPDKTFIIKETPDRGEKQRAAPIQRDL